MVNPSDRSCQTCKFGFGAERSANKSDCQWAGMGGFLSAKMPLEIKKTLSSQSWCFDFSISENNPYFNCEGYMDVKNYFA